MIILCRLTILFSILSLGSTTDSTDFIQCNCTNCGTSNICTTDGGCQKSVDYDQSKKLKIVSYRCIGKESWTPIDRPFVCHFNNKATSDRNAACCRNESFCAQFLEVDVDISHFESEIIKSDQKSPIVVISVFLIVGCLMFSMGIFISRRKPDWFTKCLSKSRKSLVCGRDSNNSQINDPLFLESYQNIVDNVRSILDPTSSGSGRGNKLLVHRTVARQITLEEGRIGQGRFGEVKLGVRRGKHVAVKIFPTREENSWMREFEIYQTPLMRHDNLLFFIAADKRDFSDIGRPLELWLVTEYHPNGSLYEYLTLKSVEINQMTRMCQSIAAGLAFLHDEIKGTSHKPPMAHRDIKSRNILVKLDGSCCLADLGLAVRFVSNTIDVPCNNKVGTRRYLAPEVLDDSMNENQFDSYRRADIYSMALVFWEICRRTNISGQCEAFELPYYEYVPADPSLEDMRQCVCVNQHRPGVPERWRLSKAMDDTTRLMRECWARNPGARLTALRVRKTMEKIGEAAYGVEQGEMDAFAIDIDDNNPPQQYYRNEFSPGTASTSRNNTSQSSVM